MVRATTTAVSNSKLGFRRESLLRKQRNNAKMISFRLPKDKTHQLLHYHSDEEEEEDRVCDHAADNTVTTMDSSRDQHDDSSSSDDDDDSTSVSSSSSSSSTELDESSNRNAEPQNGMNRRMRAFQRFGNRMTSNRMTSFRLPKDKTHQLLAMHFDEEEPTKPKKEASFKKEKKSSKKTTTAKPTEEATNTTPEIKYSPLLHLPLPPPLRVSKYLLPEPSKEKNQSSSKQSNSNNMSDHQKQPKEKALKAKSPKREKSSKSPKKEKSNGKNNGNNTKKLNIQRGRLMALKSHKNKSHMTSFRLPKDKTHQLLHINLDDLDDAGSNHTPFRFQ